MDVMDLIFKMATLGELNGTSNRPVQLRLIHNTSLFRNCYFGYESNMYCDIVGPFLRSAFRPFVSWIGVQ